MSRVYFRAVPFDKNSVTLALESGVDGVIVPRDRVDLVSGLSRSEVWADEDVNYVTLNGKQDEEDALSRLRSGERLVLSSGWEIIPIENLLAQTDNVLVEADSLDAAGVASGILERGVAGVVAPETLLGDLKEIVRQCKTGRGKENLTAAEITSVRPAGLGHRVCLDTLTIMKRGEGMLVGNSGAFTFLVHAETEHNDYVASRPFRVNAGAAHSYIRMPGDKTAYLNELVPGDELLAVKADGEAYVVTLGRVKTEVRPMLLIEARVRGENGETRAGAVFLQNAETIRLTAPDGTPLSVVSLKPGDKILCRLDEAGRHFGMRVKEEIREL